MLHLHLSEPHDPALVGLGSALAELVPLRRCVFRHGLAGAAWRLVRRGPRRVRRALSGSGDSDPGPGTTVFLTGPVQAVLLDSLDHEARVVYYAKDNFAVGHDWTPARVGAWEARIARRSSHVVAVSRALAETLRRRLALPGDAVIVSPNAVPADVVPPSCPAGPRPPPSFVPRRARRPLAGVLGRVSSRLRLGWLRAVVERTPWLDWIFVGDVERDELRTEDVGHLAWLRRHSRCHFTGRRAYRDLCDTAAAVDVAVLPYSDASINPWASPMRLFLHLPFGRPMLATPGCPQVEEFEPLVTTCRSVDELAAALERLRACGFDDALGPERWRAAREHTWACRAAALLGRLGSHAGAVA